MSSVKYDGDVTCHMLTPTVTAAVYSFKFGLMLLSPYISPQNVTFSSLPSAFGTKNKGIWRIFGFLGLLSPMSNYRASKFRKLTICLCGYQCRRRHNISDEHSHHCNLHFGQKTLQKQNNIKTRMVQLPATAAIEYVAACCRTRELERERERKLELERKLKLKLKLERKLQRERKLER